MGGKPADAVKQSNNLHQNASVQKPTHASFPLSSQAKSSKPTFKTAIHSVLVDELPERESAEMSTVTPASPNVARVALDAQ